MRLGLGKVRIIEVGSLVEGERTERTVLVGPDEETGQGLLGAGPVGAGKRRVALGHLRNGLGLCQWRHKLPEKVLEHKAKAGPWAPRAPCGNMEQNVHPRLMGKLVHKAAVVAGSDTRLARLPNMAPDILQEQVGLPWEGSACPAYAANCGVDEDLEVSGVANDSLTVVGGEEDGFVITCYIYIIKHDFSCILKHK